MDSYTDRNESTSFECNCNYEKKYKVSFDGGDSGNYVVEYCEKCFGQDDKQFMISMEMMKNGF